MDPINAILQLAVLGAIVWVRDDLRVELKRIRSRVNRVESAFIPDGGEREDDR